MRRAIKGITVAFFIMMLLMASLVPLALAQPANVPHENPNTAEDTFQAYSIFDAYSVIVGFLENGSFPDVDEILGEMGQIQLPESIRGAVDAYYSLISEVSAELSEIDKILASVNILISDDLWAEAGDKLDDANLRLIAVEVKIGDIRAVTEDLKMTLDAFILDSVFFANVYNRYLDIIDKVELLRLTYEELQQQLEDDIALAGLDTTITLDISPQTVWVGEQLTFSGRLTYADNTLLPDREVVVVLGDMLPMKIQTDDAGYYATTIEVDYDYVSTVVAKVAYSPKTDDRDKYKATYTQQNVDISFNTTELDLIDVPSQLLIGFPNIITGSVGGDEVWISGRTVQLYLDTDLVKAGLTDAQGHFELPLIPPATYDLGNHTLKVIVEPDNSEKCSGTYKSAEVQIYRAYPEVTVNTATYIILSSSMIVSGEATYEEAPVTDAEVIVNFAGIQKVTTTDDDGQYSVEVGLPSSSIAMGSQEVSVSVIPQDAWLGSVTVGSEVLAFSLLNMGFLSAAVVVVGVVLYKSRKRLALELAEAKAPLDLATEPDLTESFVSSGNMVLDLYHEAVLIVGQLTGVSFEVNATLREYLAHSNLKQSGVREVFSKLTHLAEVSLYSGALPDASFDEAQKAYDDLRQELINGPA